MFASAPRSERRPRLAELAVLSCISGYKTLVSPLFSGCCRFQPSCADYMAEAVRTHGVWRGSLLGIRRLLRCLPLGGWGPDPVPPTSPR